VTGSDPQVIGISAFAAATVIADVRLNCLHTRGPGLAGETSPHRGAVTRRRPASRQGEHHGY